MTETAEEWTAQTVCEESFVSLYLNITDVEPTVGSTETVTSAETTESVI